MTQLPNVPIAASASVYHGAVRPKAVPSSVMPRGVDASMRERVTGHYQWCVRVLRARDGEGFLDWLGPDGTFRMADTPSSATPTPGRSGSVDLATSLLSAVRDVRAAYRRRIAAERRDFTCTAAASSADALPAAGITWARLCRRPP